MFTGHYIYGDIIKQYMHEHVFGHVFGHAFGHVFGHVCRHADLLTCGSLDVDEIVYARVIP